MKRRGFLPFAQDFQTVGDIFVFVFANRTAQFFNPGNGCVTAAVKHLAAQRIDNFQRISPPFDFADNVAGLAYGFRRQTHFGIRMRNVQPVCGRLPASASSNSSLPRS